MTSAVPDELRDRLIEAGARAMVDVSALPEWMQVPALGKRLAPVAEVVVDAVLPLVRAELAAAEQRGAEKAAQAIEAEYEHAKATAHRSLSPIPRYSLTYDYAARLAREAVPEEPQR
jgi:hypothetical protein